MKGGGALCVLFLLSENRKPLDYPPCLYASACSCAYLGLLFIQLV